jgi:hypothetical protein
MKPKLWQASMLAACLALSTPAAANDSEIPAHADRFVRALQQQRFDDAAAMFKHGVKHDRAATAAQLKRISTRIGGFETMHNVLSLPDGTTLKFAFPAADPLVPMPNRYHQVAYKATAADSQPVFYILALDGGTLPQRVPCGGTLPQRVLWFEVLLPTPDSASATRAERALGDIM